MEWKNFDLLESYKKLEAMKETVNVKELMSGENGAKRVKEYQIPMASGMTYCYAAKQVDDKLLEVCRSSLMRQNLQINIKHCITVL